MQSHVKPFKLYATGWEMVEVYL